MNNIRLLGEDDFLSAMENENKTWRKEHVTRDCIISFDQTKLNYYVAEPEKPKACVVIIHGLNEFFGKYHEYIWYLNQAGFKVFFMEQRGFGYSEGKLDIPDYVYVDSFNTYVKDIKNFLDKIVVPNSQGLDLLLIAHSMGGAVGTLFLEKYPSYFKAAILTSPMIKMKAGNISPIVEILLRIYVFLFRKQKSLAPNQTLFNPNTAFETSSACSRARFEYQLNQRKNDYHYQTSAVTYGWALASLKVRRDILKKMHTIRIPLTVMKAGDDHLIDPVGYEELKERIPQAKLFYYEKSRHEIFNAEEETRKKYYSDVINALHSWEI